MAGNGARFADAGYTKPKPFIDVFNTTMIECVMENLSMKRHNTRFILIARKEHLEREKNIVRKITNNYNVKFISIDSLTEGTACTVLHARKYINNNLPLIIANSDQIVDINIDIFVEDCLRRKLDGSILTFFDKHKDSKWSFAKTNSNNLVTQVKEKEAISNHATVGIYFFSKGHYFVDSAIDMIINNDRVGNEFYTCPVYNYLIKEDKDIGIFDIDPIQMHGLGTPEDLNRFLNKK